MVDIHSGIRGAFPSACLVLIGLYFATHGAGRFSLDRVLESRLAGHEGRSTNPTTG